MKHRKLFTKLFIFCMVVIASLIGAYFAQTVDQVLFFTFTTGLGMGVADVYITEIIKKTII